MGASILSLVEILYFITLRPVFNKELRKSSMKNSGHLGRVSTVDHQVNEF